MTPTKQPPGLPARFREGDTLVVTKVDRLARSTADFLNIVESLKGRDIALRVLDFGGGAVDTGSASGKLMLTLFAGFGEFERALMLERQRAGIEAARRAGKYAGRKPTARIKADEIRRMWSDGVSGVEIARTLRISKSAVYQIVDEAPERSVEIARAWRRRTKSVVTATSAAS